MIVRLNPTGPYHVARCCLRNRRGKWAKVKTHCGHIRYLQDVIPINGIPSRATLCQTCAHAPELAAQ